MEIKILQVFLGADGLPYKDQERTVHFPIIGSGFQGASNTTKIRFYYDELVEQDDTETSWVSCAKLPNGKIGSKVLETDYDSALGEHYALLELDSFYFQYKGDVYISLQGYQGGVQVDYDEETELYTIYGTPTIAATGSIKLSVDYATQFMGSGETSNVNFQRILADLGTKLGIRATSVFVEELPTVGNPDTFYVINNDLSDPNKVNIYIWNSVTEHYIWVGDNTLDLGDYYTQEQGDQFEQGIEQRVESVESSLIGVASGSPAGVYATASDLTTADPDHSKIYLVTADGKWYYYDTSTSAWTAGGTYQSTGITIGSIGLEKLRKDIAQNFESTNMFDKTTIQSGYFNSDGTINTSVANSQYGAQYIPVKYGTTYSYLATGQTTSFATYDAEGNFIERINKAETAGIRDITFGSSIAYIRISIYGYNFPVTFMFCEKDKYATYQDYNLQLNIKDVVKKYIDENFDNESENTLENKTITNYLFYINEKKLVSDIDGIESHTGYGSNYGTGVGIVEQAGYISYYFVADKSMDIWVDDTIPDDKYYSICVGRNYTETEQGEGYILLKSSNPARYRNTDNNLPTENNKLTINAGDVLVFSFYQNTMFYINGVQKEFIPKIQKENYKYTKTINQLTIDTPKARYIFKLVQNETIRINTWRLYNGYLRKDDNSLFKMWEDSDAEGVIRLADEDDYIGGYHGDETMTAIKIYADGIDITSETNKTGYFDNISIYVNSDVYHCNTSSTPNVIAFKRSKQLIFCKEKVTVCNYWVAQEQMEMMNTPLSLFQINWKENDVEMTTSYSVKPYYKLYTMQETAEHTYPASSELMTEAYIENKIHPVVFRVLDCNGSSKLGVVAEAFVSTQNRIKIYYYNISAFGTVINQDDVLYSQFEFEVK